MESNLGQLGINSSGDVFKDYMERFEIWFMTRNLIKDDKFTDHFLTFMWKEAYNLLNDLAFPEKPIPLLYESLK